MYIPNKCINLTNVTLEARSGTPAGKARGQVRGAKTQPVEQIRGSLSGNKIYRVWKYILQS